MPLRGMLKPASGLRFILLDGQSFGVHFAEAELRLGMSRLSVLLSGARERGPCRPLAIAGLSPHSLSRKAGSPAGPLSGRQRLCPDRRWACRACAGRRTRKGPCRRPVLLSAVLSPVDGKAVPWGAEDGLEAKSLRSGAIRRWPQAPSPCGGSTAACPASSAGACAEWTCRRERSPSSGPTLPCTLRE